MWLSDSQSKSTRRIIKGSQEPQVSRPQSAQPALTIS